MMLPCSLILSRIVPHSAFSFSVSGFCLSSHLFRMVRDFNPEAAWSSDFSLTLCFLCNATMVHAHRESGRALCSSGLARSPIIIRAKNRQCFTLVPHRTPNTMRRPLFPCNGTMARVYSEFGRALSGGGLPQCHGIMRAETSHVTL